MAQGRRSSHPSPSLDPCRLRADNRPTNHVKPHELFKQVDPAIVAELFTTFRDEERDVYKSALASLAQSRKLRPVFIQKKPVVEQIAWMHKTLKLRGSDMIGEHLLQVWFMKFQQPLLMGFCDGMGIAHNGEGSVEGELPAELDVAKLKETVEGLYADFNPKVVSLYLYLFNLQRPGGWDALTDTLANDGRIVLGIDPEPQPEPEEASAGEAEAMAEPEGEPDVPEGEPDVPEEEPDVPEGEPDVPEEEQGEGKGSTPPGSTGCP